MTLTSLSTRVTAAQAGRCDLVVRELTSLSRSRIRGLFDHGCVRVNGHPCDQLGTVVKEDDLIGVDFDPNQGYKPKKQVWSDRTFSVIFEDSSLLIVNKAAGVLTVPTDHCEANTLVDRVSVYLSHSKKKQEAIVVHRLDREVSGLLVMAKSATIAQSLIEQFKHRKPERVYAAIVAGHMQAETGTFRSHLATGKNMDRFSAPPSADTELAITHYQITKRMRNTTLLDVRLETGRRHQIRVHLAGAGHPVLGDPRYGNRESRHPNWTQKRLALHARSLTLVHPLTNETITFESPLPIEMQRFVGHPSNS